jgi:hypothetical protein
VIIEIKHSLTHSSISLGVTAVDLFRSGNATSPRLGHVRITGAVPDVDIVTDAMGDVWVLANGKGVSTWDAPDPGWRGKPWLLPSGSPYSNKLVVWCDSPEHWLWQPANTMLLSKFIALLDAADAGFVPA